MVIAPGDGSFGSSFLPWTWLGPPWLWTSDPQHTTLFCIQFRPSMDCDILQRNSFPFTYNWQAASFTYSFKLVIQALDLLSGAASLWFSHPKVKSTPVIRPAPAIWISAVNLLKVKMWASFVALRWRVSGYPISRKGNLVVSYISIYTVYNFPESGVRRRHSLLQPSDSFPLTPCGLSMPLPNHRDVHPPFFTSASWIFDYNQGNFLHLPNESITIYQSITASKSSLSPLALLPFHHRSASQFSFWKLYSENNCNCRNRCYVTATVGVFYATWSHML